MAVKFFGQYLVEQGIVSRETLLKAIELQEMVNLKFGEMAKSIGLITDAAIEKVHKAQWKEDLPFGDMAIKLGILTSEQMQQVLTKQKNSHLYIGEALFKVGGLDREELTRYLEKFKADQAPYTTGAVEIPHGTPLPILWEVTADLTFKMLTRIASLSFRPEKCRTIDHIDPNHVAAAIRLNGQVSGQYILSVSAGAQKMIARGILGEATVEKESKEVLDDTTMEFINVVCGNIVAKLAQLGKSLDISPPELLDLGRNGIQLENGKKGLLFPIVMADEEKVELIIVIG